MKKMIMLMFALLTVIVIASSVSASIKLCLLYGEAVPNATQPIYKCKYDSCIICVSENLYPANWNSCNDLASCTYLANMGNQSTAPEMNISSPIDNSVYNVSGILFNITAVNSRMKFTFKDMVHPERGWQSLCSSCGYIATKRTLNEGHNYVTIMGTDGVGRSVQQDFQFTIDSQRPTISLTAPIYRGYTSGTFTVTYSELNLKNVTLMYLANGSSSFVNFTTDACPAGLKKSCNITIPGLPKGAIYYRFFLRDNFWTVGSQQILANVDTIAPVMTVNSPKSGTFPAGSFKFNITTTEAAKLSYIDYNVTRPTWTTLCSSCTKLVLTKSFTRGYHRMVIKAEDLAKNSDVEEVILNIP